MFEPRKQMMILSRAVRFHDSGKIGIQLALSRAELAGD
jgi:hypothetical protein